MNPRLLLLLFCSLPLFAQESGETADLVNKMQELDELTRLVQRESAMPVAREQLWSGALHGMVAALDAHSRYLAPDEVALTTAMNAGRGHGYGFDWRLDEVSGQMRISRVIPDSPAWRSPVYAGDRLLAIDGHEVATIGITQARRRLLQSGSAVSLRLAHADGTVDEILLERADFSDRGLLPGRFVARGIGLIRLSRFLDGGTKHPERNTARAFRAELDRLNEAGLQALIIDLRGNGGGSLIAAVDIADCFLNAGHSSPTVIARQHSRNPARSNEFIARSVNTYPDWPLAVLIDGDTASSAEVLAAALQDHQRATLIGSHSQGKTSIQELFLLDGGSALMLTVAHLIGPREESLGTDGITPDIPLTIDAKSMLALQQQERLLIANEPLPDALAQCRDPHLVLATNCLRATLIHLAR